jgi:uncharacterized protein (TIGR02611 family)
MDFLKRNSKRILLESLGWVLVALGLAAIVLPGPGLLMLFAGLALLATQYEWAERRVEPIRKAALKTAADSVKSWPRIITSTVFCLALIGIGICWGIQPPAPSWWPLADKWWLVGGWGTGGTIIGSGAIALITIGYSFWAFRLQAPKHKQ